MKEHEDRDGHKSRAREVQNKVTNPDALFGGSAPAKFGLGPASAGSAAAMKRVTNGRPAPPPQEKADVASGMSREATQELGRRRSSNVMVKAYQEARLEEAGPEIRVALKRVSDGLEVGRIAQELRECVSRVNEGDGGQTRSASRLQR